MADGSEFGWRAAMLALRDAAVLPPLEEEPAEDGPPPPPAAMVPLRVLMDHHRSLCLTLSLARSLALLITTSNCSKSLQPLQ